MLLLMPVRATAAHAGGVSLSLHGNDQERRTRDKSVDKTMLEKKMTINFHLFVLCMRSVDELRQFLVTPIART